MTRWATRWRTTGSSLQRLAVDGRLADVVGEDADALLDLAVGEHREALEVERLGDVLEAAVEVADHVVVVHEHVVEEDLVGALVAHRPDGPDGEAGVVERHEEQRDAVVLGCVGVGAGADPVPLGEVRRGGPGLLAVEPPAVAVAGGLELHVGRVGAGVGLGVADGELDLVAQDLGQELGLELVGAVLDQRLADDADALADLRGAPPGQRLVEQVLVDAVALGPAVLLRPGHAQPAPLADLGHERAALGRVADLRHVLARRVHDLDGLVLVEERLDLGEELLLLLRELEVHAGVVSPGQAGRTPDLTKCQITCRERAGAIGGMLSQ